MTENIIIKKDVYYCNICNKNYKTYKTLWEHNKKFHTINVKNVNDNVKKYEENVKTNVKNVKKSLICNYCNKLFNTRAAKSIHKKTCYKNNTNPINSALEIIKEENKKLDTENKNKELELLVAKEKKEILKHEENILKLKLKLEKSEMIDNVTLRQLNKKLMERNNLIKKSMVHFLPTKSAST